MTWEVSRRSSTVRVPDGSARISPTRSVWTPQQNVWVQPEGSARHDRAGRKVEASSVHMRPFADTSLLEVEEEGDDDDNDDEEEVEGVEEEEEDDE